MARKKRQYKREITPDPKYNSVMIAKFINHIMHKGEKSTALHIVYKTFDIIKKKTKREPTEVFDEALKNVAPVLEVKSKRIGGANYQIPIEVRAPRKSTLAMRWLIKAARAGRGKSMPEKLASELIAASRRQGEAMKQRENIQRMAEANRAFAHFA